MAAIWHCCEACLKVSEADRLVSYDNVVNISQASPRLVKSSQTSSNLVNHKQDSQSQKSDKIMTMFSHSQYFNADKLQSVDQEPG